MYKEQEQQHQFKPGDKVFCMDNEGDVVYAGYYRGESLKHPNHSIVAVRVNEDCSIERYLPHDKMLSKP